MGFLARAINAFAPALYCTPILPLYSYPFELTDISQPHPLPYTLLCRPDPFNSQNPDVGGLFS
jgi:hypothetical protein